MADSYQDEALPLSRSWDDPRPFLYHSDEEGDSQANSDDELFTSSRPMNMQTNRIERISARGPGSMPPLNTFQKFRSPPHKKHHKSSHHPTIHPHEKNAIKRRYMPVRLANVRHLKGAWRAYARSPHYQRDVLNMKAKILNDSMDISRALTEERRRNSKCFFWSPQNVHFRFIIIALTCVMTFGSYVNYDSVSAVESSLQKDMHVSDTEIGLMYSLYNVPNIVMVVFGGVLVDKLGLRKSTFLFSFLVALGAAIFCIGPYFQNVYVCLVGRFIFGLGSESSYVAQDTITAIWFNGKELSMAMGFVGSAGRLGEFFTYYFLPQISILLGDYKWAFLISAGACVVSLLAAIIYIIVDKRAEMYTLEEESKDGTKEDSTEEFNLRDIRNFGASYWLITFISLTYYSSIFPFQAFCPEYLMMRYGYDEQKAGKITAVISIIPTVISPFLGWLLDRYGHRARAVAVGSLMLLGSYLMLLFLDTPKVVIPSLVLIGLAFSLVSGALWPCLFAVVEPRMFGTAYGLMSGILNGGNTLVYYLSGKLIKNLQIIMIVWSALAGFGFILSVIWNIVDAKTGGLANLPSQQVLVFDKGPDEDDREDEALPDSEEESEGDDPDETTPLFGKEAPPKYSRTKVGAPILTTGSAWDV